MSSPWSIHPPRDMLRAVMKAYPADFTFAAMWGLGPRDWGGVVHDGNAFVPFTWEGSEQRLTLWKRERTDHMMEAVRSAATRSDQVWIEEADYSEAEAQS